MDVRVGKVTAVSGRQVRVYFPDVDIVSDWLTVLRHVPSVSHTGETSGGSGEATFAAHRHTVSLGEWIPGIGDAVLCLYADGFNADGYVIGGL